MEQLTRIDPLIEISLKVDKFDTQNNFNESFLEAVDEAFTLLGSQSKILMYRYLENKCGVKKENIPEEVALFSKAIEAVFGQSAGIIEIRIMKALHKKAPSFTYSSKKASDLSFVNYVEAFRLFL